MNQILIDTAHHILEMDGKKITGPFEYAEIIFEGGEWHANFCTEKPEAPANMVTISIQLDGDALARNISKGIERTREYCNGNHQRCKGLY